MSLNKLTNIMALSIDLTPIAINGNTGAETILPRTQMVSTLHHVRAAKPSEIAQYSTAVSAVIINSVEYGQPRLTTILTAQTVASIKTAIAA